MSETRPLLSPSLIKSLPNRVGTTEFTNPSDLAKTWRATDRFVRLVQSALQEGGPYKNLDPGVRELFVETNTIRWLTNHGDTIFPLLDEVRIADSVIRHPHWKKLADRHYRIGFPHIVQWTELHRETAHNA